MRKLVIALLLTALMAMPVFAGEEDLAPLNEQNTGTEQQNGTETETPSSENESQQGQENESGQTDTENPENPPEEPQQTHPDGWADEEGFRVYYTGGEKATGLQTIENALYYFDDEGHMKTGANTIGKYLYVFGSNGKALSNKGWVTCEDKVKRYGIGGNHFANTSTVIKKKLYLFGKNGQKISKKGFFTYSGNTYYGQKDGSLARGYRAIKVKKKLNGYYFYKSTGIMAKNTTIGHLRIPKNGKLHKSYALGIKKLNSTKWTLKQAYKNSVDMKYYGRSWRQKTSEKYALRGFQKKKGNCYVMAAVFYIQAKLLGYDVHQVEGKVVRTHPHSWTVIYQKGKTYVYDPNFENETFRNGWKIYYGKKGTWRYTNKHLMN